MSTKPITNVTIKDGKIVRKATFRAGIKKRSAARLAKQWAAKSANRPQGSSSS